MTHRRSLLALASLLVACSGKSTRHDEDGEAGDGGTGASARGGRGGTATGGTVTGGVGATGAAPSGGAGTSGGMTGGAPTGGAPMGGTSTGGVSTGGGGTQGGASGSGGSGGCPTCTPQACTTVALPTNTINDFDNLYFADPSDPTLAIYGVLDASGSLKPDWWLGYFSGSFVYPAPPQLCSNEPAPSYPLAQSFENGRLRVTGTVAGLALFGLWLGPCVVDMSGSSGISFRVSGNAGPGSLVFSVSTQANVAPDTCQLGKGTCDTTTSAGCTPAYVTVAIPDAPAPVRIPWADLAGGTPSNSADPSEVVLLTWHFTWPTMTPYPVDVTLDDVVLFD